MNPSATHKVAVGTRGSYNLVSASGKVVGQHLVRPITQGSIVTQSNVQSSGGGTDPVMSQLGLVGAGSPSPNPIADQPNWGTGGRMTSPAASGSNPAKTWMYVGAAVVLFMLFKKKK